jgi:signal transduction histidine kinase
MVKVYLEHCEKIKFNKTALSLRSIEFVNDKSTAQIRIENTSNQSVHLWQSDAKKPISIHSSRIEFFLNALDKQSYLNSQEVSQKKKLIRANKKEIKRFNTTVKKHLSEDEWEAQRFFQNIASLDHLNQLAVELRKFRFFSNYNSVRVLTLIKGHSFASSAEVRKKNIIDQKKISAFIFQRYFLEIKKSKTAYFTYSKKIASDLKIIGDYIAKTMQLKNEQFIFVLSNEDLFPPANKHIAFFNQLIDRLESPLSFVCSKIRQAKDVEVKNRILQSIQSTTLINFNKGADNGYRNTSNAFHYQRVQLIGELFNTVRHELSNPLCGMEMFIQLLKPVVSRETKPLAEQIEERIKHCKDIIQTFNNIYSNETHLARFPLKLAINQALTLIKSESKLAKLKVLYLGDEKIELVSNQNYIIHILFNLLINALQVPRPIVTKNKVVQLTIETNNKEVSIEVKDNGIGINKTIKENIFDSFYTTKTKGTGLGLAISKTLSERIGAKLILGPTDYSGTSFFLILSIQ